MDWYFSQTIKTLGLLLASFFYSSASYGQDALSDEQVSEFKLLKERVSALEAEQDKVDADNNVGVKEDKYIFSGFGSFVATQLSEDDAVGPSGETSDLSIKPHSLMGLQFEALLSDSTRALIQLVAEADEDLSPEIEWMLIEQRIFPFLSLKLGRFGYAAYSESTHAKVGYTYPTIALNDEVYIRSLVESIDGASVDFTVELAGWSWLLNFYGGEREVEKQAENVELDMDGLYGFALEAEREAWYWRVAWHSVKEIETTLNDIQVPQGQLGCLVQTCPFSLVMENDQINAAIKYNGDAWYWSYEFSQLESDNEFVGKVTGQSATLAYRIEAFQPYLQWGHYKTSEVDVSPTGTNLRHQQSAIIGLRHDFTPFVAAKYQLKYMFDFDDSRGLFNYYNGQSIDFEDAWSFDIGLQFVFDERF